MGTTSRSHAGLELTLLAGLTLGLLGLVGATTFKAQMGLKLDVWSDTAEANNTCACRIKCQIQVACTAVTSVLQRDGTMLCYFSEDANPKVSAAGKHFITFSRTDAQGSLLSTPDQGIQTTSKTMATNPETTSATTDPNALMTPKGNPTQQPTELTLDPSMGSISAPNPTTAEVTNQPTTTTATVIINTTPTETPTTETTTTVAKSTAATEATTESPTSDFYVGNVSSDDQLDSIAPLCEPDNPAVLTTRAQLRQVKKLFKADMEKGQWLRVGVPCQHYDFLSKNGTSEETLFQGGRLDNYVGIESSPCFLCIRFRRRGNGNSLEWSNCNESFKVLCQRN